MFQLQRMTCLVVDADTKRGRSLASSLSSEATVVRSAEAAIGQGQPVELVVVVMPERTADVMALRAWAASLPPPTAQVIAVVSPDVDGAALFASGANDVVFDGPELADVARRVVASVQASRGGHVIEAQRTGLESARADLLYGPAPGDVVRTAYRVARTDASVLITGETGTGKELLARSIHEASARADRPFVAVSLAALPPDLVEAELFGHAVGAFTGAVRAREGRVELAATGTLFLDEVGDLPMQVQVKLLRLLQERTFERIGESRVRNAEFRLVCATHRDLSAQVEAGTFREDLFYRLDVVHLSLPPLRHRATEIRALAQYYLGHFARRAGRDVVLSDEALAALEKHAWPGNIRELKHTLERAVASAADGAVLGADLVRPRGRSEPLSRAAADVFAGRCTLDDLLGDIERAVIAQAMQLSEGSQTRAAQLLGLPRQTLAHRMKR